MDRNSLGVILMVFSLALAAGFSNTPTQGAMMKIETSAFQEGKAIPKKYTCQGTNVSPPLFIIDAPKQAASFALIVDDPDAPNGTFDHWIAWNIPANTKSLAEGAIVKNQGTNGFGEKKYQGPCPPPGKVHRYYFKLYALDIQLTLPEGSSKAQLEKAMDGHILAKASVMGTFQR